MSAVGESPRAEAPSPSSLVPERRLRQSHARGPDVLCGGTPVPLLKPRHRAGCTAHCLPGAKTASRRALGATL